MALVRSIASRRRTQEDRRAKEGLIENRTAIGDLQEKAPPPFERRSFLPSSGHGLLVCDVVVLFVPSSCAVVVLLFDCPVAGFDVEELVVVLFGSDVDDLLSV